MRPVYHPLALEELISQSDTIVLVEREEPLKSVAQIEENGCTAQRWPLTVQTVLKAPADRVHPGQVLPVLVNAIPLMTCGFDKRNISVSYPVRRYVGFDYNFYTAPSRRFVAFLKTGPRGPEMTAVGAFETEARIGDIVRLIKP
ncbi:hypothetical protein [Massilia sp. CF038]|uniref:hypothetical protein n=1 Tax=Massilia sp. CF038 TaxID=1881045 RepID=UPI00090FF3CD|nr:hypothetical protein [Massilia sp. CF038]SHH21090.1 hypothetical protein SAMN05428948_3330 [Massilia sp. CF038]